METAFSKPLEEIPWFLSAISMVGDDPAQTIRDLVHSERKSPLRYRPASERFRGVLEGRFTVKEALAQAELLRDEVQRKCAQDTLVASRPYLLKQPPARVGLLSPMGVTLPNGMEFRVSPVWLRHLSPPRLMVLHFWLRPLTGWQLSAAAAILVEAMKRDPPALTSLELDFISVSRPEHSTSRHLQVYNWEKLDRLDEEGLSRFLGRLCAAWEHYRSLELRIVKSRPHETRLL